MKILKKCLSVLLSLTIITCILSSIPFEVEAVSNNRDIWKDKYIEYINNLSTTSVNKRFSLIDLDGNGIPELFFDSGSYLGGKFLSSFSHGEINTVVIGGAIFQWGNLVYCSTGQMGFYRKIVYEINNGIVDCIFDGKQAAKNITDFNMDNPNDFTYSYRNSTFSDEYTTITYSEFNNLLISAFDESQAQEIEFQYDSSNIINAINNYQTVTNWKQIYTNYIDQCYVTHSRCAVPEYALAQIDDDSTPELILRAIGTSFADRSFWLIWVSDGQLNVEKQSVEQYKQKSGKFYSRFRGGMRAHVLEGNEIKNIHTATWYGDYIAVDGNLVDEATCNAMFDEILDYGDQYPEYKSKEQIIKDINEFNSIEYDITQLDNEILSFENYTAKYYSEYVSEIADIDMTYKDIEKNYETTAYAVNNILSFGWKSKFGFTDSAQVWETVLLDILFKSGAHSTSVNAWEKTSIKTSKSIVKFLEKNNISNIDSSINFNTKVNLQKFAEQYDASKGFTESTEIKTVVNKLIDSAKSIKEFVDLYSKYISLRKSLDDNTKVFLSKMQDSSKCKNIPAFSRAIEKIINNIEVDNIKLAEIIIQEKTSDKILQVAINTLLGLTVKVLLGEKVFALVDITKTTTIHLLNTVLGVGDKANFNVYLYILNCIDDAASETLKNAAEECIESNGQRSSRIILGGMVFFSCLYTCGIKTCCEWAEVIATDIFERIESGPYINLKVPHYDWSTEYLNLNHKSSKYEKVMSILQSCDEDDRYIDTMLGNLPFLAYLSWNRNIGNEEDENRYVVVYIVKNPNGTSSYYAEYVEKYALFHPPILPSKSGYLTPEEWYSDPNCKVAFNIQQSVTQNTILYSQYKTTIWHELTSEKDGVKILNMNSDGIIFTPISSVGAFQNLPTSISNNQYEIPAFIDGYEVVELGNDIFYECGMVSSVRIPSTIKIINENTFNSLSPQTQFSVLNGSIAEEFIKQHNYNTVLVLGKIGDSNLDGAIAISDATTIQMFIAEMIGYDNDQKKASDTNDDGRVTISDVTAIQRYLAGLIDHFGQTESVYVSLNPSQLLMNIGEKITLIPTITPSTAANNVTWTSSNQKIATVTNGIVEAKCAGTANITVSCNGKSATCIVTVKPVEADSITISKSNLSLNVGETYQLNATINPNNTTDKAVTWTSSNTTVATVSSGTVTAKSKGTVVISAKTVNGKTATCNITVNPIVPESITLSKSHIELDTNQEQTLIATVYPSNAEDKSVTWISGNTSILSVSETGKIQALSNGKTSVTAKTTNGKTAVCEVEVYQPISGSLSLTLFLSREPNGYARLTKDITLSSQLPICDTEFKGCLNGDNHTITYDFNGSTNNAIKDVYKAFFAKTNGAIIKNIRTTGSIEHTMSSDSLCGNFCAGLVANAQNTVFENCNNTAKIKGSFWGSDSAYGLAGGITAQSYNCEFIGCSNSGELVCNTYSKKESVSTVGGISGQSNNCKYIACNNSGTLFPQAILDECENPEICSAVSGGIAGVVENSEFNYCESNGKIGALIWPKNTTKLESFAASGGIAGTGNATFLNCSSHSELLPTVNGIGKTYKDDVLAKGRS